MKRWTNGLPGATMRLGAMMAQRGLSASQPRMRADTHVGPELNAPLQRPDTLMQLSRSSLSEIRLVQRGRAMPRTCATARPQLAKADTAFQGASVGPAVINRVLTMRVA